MRCPACGADNPEEARRCVGCKARMGRRSRSQNAAGESDSPFRAVDDPGAKATQQAYLVCVYSLIPFLGLVLGPLSVLLAVGCWWRYRASTDEVRRRHLLVTVLLGLTTTLANGAGLALMYHGLTSGQP